MSRITLRAKSDGTEISGELRTETGNFFEVDLAPDTDSNLFYKEYWGRVHELPTEWGTIFEAEVSGVPTVLMACGAPSSPIYCTLDGAQSLYPSSIDASTVRIGKVVFE